MCACVLVPAELLVSVNKVVLGRMLWYSSLNFCLGQVFGSLPPTKEAPGFWLWTGLALIIANI